MRAHGGTLTATNIVKGYAEDVVLDGVSLVVPPRARIGVVGPNGSGKSTLLKVLAGLEKPDSGRVVTTSTRARWRVPVRTADVRDLWGAQAVTTVQSREWAIGRSGLLEPCGCVG